MVDIEQLLLAFAIEYRREIFMPVTAVGSAATASVPKIDPVIFDFIASLLVARRDVDFSHQSDVRLCAYRSDVLVSIPIMVECGSNHFHPRRHPLDRTLRLGIAR